MATKSGNLRKTIIFVLFIIVLFLVSILALVFPGLTPTEHLWSGFYTFLVPEEVDPKTVVNRLEKAGFSRVLAEPTAIVSYNAVVGLRTIPVSSIHDRFESIDPRVDPYMSRLPAYFHTLNGRRPMRIYYIESSGAPAQSRRPIAVRRRVVSALADQARPATIVLLEWGVWRAALLVGAFILYAAVLFVRSTVERPAVLLGALLWIPWILVGSASTFIAGCISLFIFVLWLEELVPLACARTAGTVVHVRRFAVRIAFSALGMVGTFVALAVSGRDGIAALAVAGSGSIVVAGLVVYIRRSRARESEHPPFVPLDILTPSLWDALRGRHPSPVLSIAPFVMLPLAVLAFLPKTHSPFVPEPKPVVGAEGIDSESLRILWTHEEQNSLPDLADYLAHRAYQEGFLYGADYGFPDGELTIARFRREGETITRWEEAVAVYDESWYDATVASAAEPSIAALLAAQGAPASVVFTPIAVVFSRGATLPGLLLVVLLVFAPFVVSFTPAVSVDLLLRGKRQEA